MASSLIKSGLLLASLASVVSAHPKVVQMNTYRTERKVVAKRSSANPFSVDVNNNATVGLYYVEAKVGTPTQTVQLQIDTGSSDVWMFGPGSCDASTSQCLGGVFDYNSSSTAQVLGAGQFSIQYVTPNSGVTGDYISDNFAIGGQTINNLTMAVATNAAYVPTGIMGIGFDTDESSNAQAGVVYPNIIDDMVSQGLINARAYSLWLNDLDSSTGTVLFGGYDTEKYTGDLTFLQIQPDLQSGNITSMTVAWTSLSLTDPNQGTTQITSSDFVAPAVLDSGTTLTGLPADIYDNLATFAGVINDPDYGAIVQCNISSYTGTLDYGFGGANGPVIHVPFYELAVPAVDQDGNPLTFQDGSAACTFGLFPTDDGQEILFGDTFLRSAYVLYDLDAQQIGIAPTVFNTTKSNVQAVGSNGDVSGQSSVITGVTAKQTATATKLQGPGIAQTGTGVATVATVSNTPHASFGILTGSHIGGATSTPSATGKKSAASQTVPAFDVTAFMVLGGTFVLMLCGGGAFLSLA